MGSSNIEPTRAACETAGWTRKWLAMGVGMRRRRVILKSADLLLQMLLLFYFKQHTAPGATANTATIQLDTS